MKNMQWKKGEMVKYRAIAQLLLVCSFLVMAFIPIVSLCQQVSCKNDKIFDNNTNSFDDLIKQNIINPPERKNEKGKWVATKSPSTITRKFERYALQAGYLRKDTIEKEYTLDEQNNEKRKKELKEQYELSIKLLESLLKCSIEHIKNIAKQNKKYIDYDQYLILINKVYNFIKNTTAGLRKEYQKARNYFKSPYVNAILEKINEFQIDLAYRIDFIIQDSEIWKKDVGSKSLDKIFPKYAEFFKNYEHVKKNLISLTPKEIFYHLFTSGILKTGQKGQISEEVVVSDFVEKLQRFLFALDKSWFVSNKKNIVNDSKEILAALRSMYPVYSKNGALLYITQSDDFPSVFIVDIGAVLWDMLRDLKVNIINIQKS